MVVQNGFRQSDHRAGSGHALGVPNLVGLGDVGIVLEMLEGRNRQVALGAQFADFALVPA